MMKVSKILVLVIALFVEIEGPFCYTDGDLMVAFLSGLVVSRGAIEILREENPCLSQDCGTGTCVIRSTDDDNEDFQALCLCDTGFCGADCQPSTVLTDQTCTDGLCRIPRSLCIEDVCRCNCTDVFIADTEAASPSITPVCRAGCTDGLSNSFLTIPNARINEVARSIAAQPSLQVCQDACVAEANFECVSVSVLQVGAVFQCSLHKVRRDDPTLFEADVNADNTYFERLCN